VYGAILSNAYLTAYQSTLEILLGVIVGMILLSLFFSRQGKPA